MKCLFLSIQNILNYNPTEKAAVTEASKEVTTEEVLPESAIVGFNEPVELEETELNKYLEELEEEEEELEEEITKQEVEEEKVEQQQELEDKNCLTRPDSLPLDNVVEQKKDINLIGMC